MNEKVVRQPSMLRAGTLRDYQLVGCYIGYLSLLIKTKKKKLDTCFSVILLVPV